MTLLKDNDYRAINIALLSLEADVKKLNKNTNFDAQLAAINKRIDEINTGDDVGAEIKNIKNDIKAIDSDIENINTEIDGIEQKLANIFSAENKVTDFNTTTNSGIYYWITDAANRPTNYGVLLVNKYDSGSGSTWINQIAYGTNGRIYFRQKINDGSWREWKAVAYLDDIEKTTTKSVSLSTVTTGTTKYIKLGTFRWSDSFSFKCRIAGNSFEDNVNVNILSGHSSITSVCGYYSTNGRLTKSIIVKRGDAWNSNFEIYLKIVQLTTANVFVTIDKDHQDRINISESTTAPSGTLEEIAFNNSNGMFSSNIDAKNLILESDADVELDTFGNEPLSIGNKTGNNIGIDGNEIQARDNGKASILCLNNNGGDVQVGTSWVSGTKLIIQCKTVNSNSYTDTNPKLVFKNSDNSQNISLTFTDFDAVQAPASLTLNGNQGNEYFIAPCIKANNKMRIPIGAPSQLEDGCIWIS